MWCGAVWCGSARCVGTAVVAGECCRLAEGIWYFVPCRRHVRPNGAPAASAAAAARHNFVPPLLSK